MKKSLVATGATIAVMALVAFGSVSPASADVTVVAPIYTAETGSADYYGFGAAVSNDGSYAAAGLEYAGVTIYNVAAGTQMDISMATLGSTDIGEITFSPDNQYLYVANYADGTIIVVNVSDGSVAREISLGFSPWMVEASRDGAWLYAPEYNTADVYKIDLSDDSVSSPLTTTGNGYVASACLSADGAKLYLPNYSNGIDVINTADMTLDDTWTLGSNTKPYSCELDNDGNLIVDLYNVVDVVKVSPTDGSVLETADLSGINAYSAVPSCDKVYIADVMNGANIPVIDLATFAEETAITPDETPAGQGFYGYNGDRSLDGSVIVLSGYYASDGMVIIKSSECATASSSSSSPSLPNTGANSAATGISLAVAGGMLIAGVIALIAIRRRNA